MHQTQTAYQFVVLHRAGLPQRLEAAFAAASSAPPLLMLARALASSPVWRDGPPAILVARPDPTPVLAAIGRFDDADEARLAALAHQLGTVLQRTIYLDHRGAEEACGILAARLRERFTNDDIARMRFVGVPRGGLIVLGMLAYALGLPRRQLQEPAAAPAQAPGPLVIVDDCVLSGLRLTQFLEERSEDDVVIATLYSHPDLRAALLERAAPVRDVISAFDLIDHAPAALGSEYEAWRARWEERGDPRTPWIGQPDHVCFPWGEPETSSWNTVTEREELGWHVIPPELCLKHRHDARAGALEARLQQAGVGDHRPSSRVVFGDLAGEIVLADLEREETYALKGIAADMWRALLATVDAERAATSLATMYDVDEETLLADTRTFLGELVAAGLLERGAR